MRLSIISLLFPFTVNALSATTVNTIQGNKPHLLLSDGVTKLTTLNELLGFKMPKQNGNAGTEQIDASMAGIALTAPTGMRYSDVVALIAADGSPHSVSGTVVGDNDGDAIVGTPTVSGTMKATWYEGGVAVPNSKLNNALSMCGGPYTLKIEANNVQANTTYGDPKINNYGSSTPITYTFVANGQGICYIRPRDLTVYNTGTLSIPGGYNSSKFILGKGFKVSSGFPTTGFLGAEFSLIGSGSNQNLFRCKSTSSDITLWTGFGVGQNCTVTYNTETKPTSPITINIEYSANGSSNWTQIDSYTIPIPSKWAIGKGDIGYGNTTSLSTSTIFPALDACRNASLGTTTWQEAVGADQTWRQNYLYTRAELTNSPLNTLPAGGTITAVDRFSRDVDGTFMGEWGRVQSYSGSGWAGAGRYWTVDVFSTDYQFFVTEEGIVDYYYPFHPSVSFMTMCRGE